MDGPVRALRFLGPALFVAGILSLAWAFSRGEASLSLVFVVPVVTASGAWGILGIGLIFASFLAGFLTWSLRAPDDIEAVPLTPARPPETSEGPRRWGGVVFLGPVPIVFGSDARITRAMLVLAAALFLAFLALTLFVVLAP